MTNSKDVRLGRIQGVLETFAMLNAGLNEDYTFSFVPLREGANLEDSAIHHLSSQESIECDSLEVTVVESVQVRIELIRWLLRFHSHTLVQNKNPAQYLVGKIFDEMMELSSNVTCYSVIFQSADWYEADWKDFILQGKQNFYLHLGVND